MLARFLRATDFRRPLDQSLQTVIWISSDNIGVTGTLHRLADKLRAILPARGGRVRARVLPLSNSRRAILLAALCVLGAVGATAAQVPEPLQKLSGAYFKSGAPADRAALLAYAERASTAETQALAYFGAGMGDYQAKDYVRAAELLKRAAESMQELGEYAVYYRARSLAGAEDYAGAAWVLADFAKRYPRSHLAPAAVRLRAESLIRSEHIEQARALLEADKLLPAAVRLFLTGRTQQLGGAQQEAIDSYRRVFYLYPLSEQAADAEQRLGEIRRAMGKSYPPAPAAWRFKRAEVLFDAGKYAKAAASYRRAAEGLHGAERDRARVRVGAADYKRLHTTNARHWLAGLKVADPEADAERLYYLVECGRRQRQTQEFTRRCEELGEKYPRSRWYEEALFALGNFYLLENDARLSRAYYERAARTFPKGERAPIAHWKVCWRAYLDQDPRARALLEEHVGLYPSSPQATAAIYWLGRLAEKEDDLERARALYAGLAERFPHYYYSELARRRLEAGGLQAGNLRVDANYFDGLPSARSLAPEASAKTIERIRRSRVLFELGLGELARKELAVSDYRTPDSYWVGLELAKQSAELGQHHLGLRYMKRYGYGYLQFPFESMPRPFWESLYPIPWENDLRQRSTPHGLDPYLVAGLIRQESEFNPGARSRAGAVGLMQIMPATGRGLARRLGIGKFSTRHLYRPDISLRLGTFHLREVLDRYQGQLELTLAAYNAGEHRVAEWITWGDFDEPGKFVETIPFTETRGYVQAVIRNAEMYRALYGPRPNQPETTVAAGHGGSPAGLSAR